MSSKLGSGFEREDFLVGVENVGQGSNNGFDEKIDYDSLVKEAYMYLDCYCGCDARKVVKRLVSSGYLDRLCDEEPKLYSLFRFGGI